MLHLVEPDVAVSAYDEDEFFPLVMVGATARGSRSETEEVGLHGGRAEGKQLEVDSRLARELDAVIGANELAGLLLTAKE